MHASTCVASSCSSTLYVLLLLISSSYIIPFLCSLYSPPHSYFVDILASNTIRPMPLRPKLCVPVILYLHATLSCYNTYTHQHPYLFRFASHARSISRPPHHHGFCRKENIVSIKLKLLASLSSSWLPVTSSQPLDIGLLVLC